MRERERERSNRLSILISMKLSGDWTSRGKPGAGLIKYFRVKFYSMPKFVLAKQSRDHFQLL